MGECFKIIVNSKRHGVKEILLDEQDYERCIGLTWFVRKCKHTFYAGTNIGGGKQVLIHRFILGVNDKPILVDHIDNNGLNNRRNNLREATYSGNNSNRATKSENKSSVYKGVYKTPSGRWQAQLMINRKWYGGGKHDSQEDAAKAYNDLAIKHHGKFANLNKI
jgi:hypothetical protein